ncbi:B12-binding domain-containing radical SAM protein [Thermosediminibacter oceani]|uniref:Cobalamin B12-binding domain protein n=1 Tax=Thermosediminibacter oceani (strain ATCC BAA-1034 / DSM 16646 / JW/IW-1228P) TaxID=555079 RepID=D9RXY9_THEOJ|nr:B12-binding domain-containing radical SAM protein [Thermosediminibacter oceani]ADL08213.1 cobalamin B12-binding domain protein [Thermosediminibacter oceani DSM 16646]
MKVLLVGLNSKYIHTNLAIRNLAAYCRSDDVKIFEATINDSIDDVLEEIILNSPQMVAFSCYIWNIDYVLYLAENLKKVSPKITVVLGGPEVSHDAGEILKRCDYVDYVIIGEGEYTFKAFLDAFRGNGLFSEIPGIAYRRDGRLYVNPQAGYVDLNEVPFSYDEQEDLSHRLVYYETSRGCPFNCAFCLSSLDKAVRTASLEKVERDLSFFVRKGVDTVKLVDRSFNCDTERAIAILDIIRRLGGNTVFHCEINPELVNDRFLKGLEGIEDRLRFEVGIQTTNPESLKEISRNPDVERALRGIERLKAAGVKLHVDLIAGLPYDDFESFSRAFDDVYRLEPDEIQLGFLKLLKGTRLRDKSEKYGMVYRSRAPYEILYNRWIGYEELAVLKGIAKLLDKYYNTGRFKYSLAHLGGTFKRPFEFYLSLYNYWRQKGLLRKELSLKSLYDHLYRYAVTLNLEPGLVKDLIKFDYMYSGCKGSPPDCINREKDRHLKDKVKALAGNQEWLKQNLPGVKELSNGNIWNKISYGYFSHDVTSDFRKREIGVIFLYTANGTHFAKFDP